MASLLGQLHDRKDSIGDVSSLPTLVVLSLATSGCLWRLKLTEGLICCRSSVYFCRARDRTDAEDTEDRDQVVDLDFGIIRR